jgi:tRNA1(Val) A37 N6-methylase TrmN6
MPLTKSSNPPPIQPQRIDERDNPQFTHEYAQPAEYRFCQDSIIFPHWLAQQLDRSKLTTHFRALDLCAGCGVIGFELAHLVPEIVNLDFLEIQTTFRDAFNENLKLTGQGDKNFRFLEMNYDRLQAPEFRGHYDLVFANPPYFHPQDGKLSPSNINNRCRFFIDSGLPALIKGTINCLKPNGAAYLLIKPGHAHGRNQIADVTRIAAELSFRTEPVADIRGTWVLKIYC